MRGYDCLDIPRVHRDDSIHGDAEMVEPLETKRSKYSFIYSFNFIKLLLLIKHDELKTKSTFLEFRVYVRKETGRKTWVRKYVIVTYE